MALGRKVLELAPTNANPRNSEGAFATLADGRILFAYTRFTGGAGDHAAAHIVSRTSADGGRTWSRADRVMLENEGNRNVMSVSLLRLADGRLAFFYLRKNSLADCRPRVRFSSDEGETWSNPRLVMNAPGYFVLNNDRVIRLKEGRLVLPTAYHRVAQGGRNPRMDPCCIDIWYLSDDNGRTWREAKTWRALPVDSNSGLQEPGVVELADGRLFSWARTDTGCQWGMYSFDRGETWTMPAPTEFKSPCSPMSIKRIPSTGDLLAVWNDHSGRFPRPASDGWSWSRRPLACAVSRDEGATWEKHRILDDAKNAGFCYIAIHFPDEENVLFAYCAGNRRDKGCLNRLRLRRVPAKAFYA